MRCAFILPRRPNFGADQDYYVGSAYKYSELLKQACEVDVVRADDPHIIERVQACDFAAIRADRFRHYEIPRDLGLPWLAIAHDLAAMRDPHTESARDERALLEGAFGVVFATEPLRVWARERYRLPPTTVIALRPLRRDLDFEPLVKLPGRTLVYAGGIGPMHAVHTPWGYRSNRLIFEAAIRGGWEVHVYPVTSRGGVDEEYAKVGCVVHKPVPERELLRELSQYTAGLQVFWTEGVPPAAVEYVRLAWPNKTWIYHAAGIPTVGVNPGFEAPRIFAGRWGIVLDSWLDLERLAPSDLPALDDDLREREVAERDLLKLRRLLARVTPATH
jgi:hypothetical protein